MNGNDFKGFINDKPITGEMISYIKYNGKTSIVIFKVEFGSAKELVEWFKITRDQTQLTIFLTDGKDNSLSGVGRIEYVSLNAKYSEHVAYILKIRCDQYLEVIGDC
jgi:fructoselysine-6-P-deglycase FrlB-like protein